MLYSKVFLDPLVDTYVIVANEDNSKRKHKYSTFNTKFHVLQDIAVRPCARLTVVCLEMCDTRLLDSAPCRAVRGLDLWTGRPLRVVLRRCLPGWWGTATLPTFPSREEISRPRFPINRRVSLAPTCLRGLFGVTEVVINAQPGTDLRSTKRKHGFGVWGFQIGCDDIVSFERFFRNYFSQFLWEVDRFPPFSALFQRLARYFIFIFRFAIVCCEEIACEIFYFEITAFDVESFESLRSRTIGSTRKAWKTLELWEMFEKVGHDHFYGPHCHFCHPHVFMLVDYKLFEVMFNMHAAMQSSNLQKLIYFFLHRYIKFILGTFNYFMIYKKKDFCFHTLKFFYQILYCI